jgi:glycosyltransferase involved in cell wall biosynthesis
LGPANPDVMEILKDGQNAVLVKPDNHLACRSALEELLGNQEEIERLGAQAAIDVAPYTYDNRAKRFLEFVNKRLQAMEGGASYS